MEKILLINPGHRYYRKSLASSVFGSIGLPLGLLYVASALEKKGCGVKVVDSLVCDSSRLIIHDDYRDYGIPSDRLKEIVKSFKPDIVGISSQFATQEEMALETARLIKEVDSSILVIVGGANMAGRGSHIIEDKNVDVVVKGEGENTICELKDVFRGSKKFEEVRGIFYKQGRQIFETDNSETIKVLDDLPTPAYHLIEMEAYLTLFRRGIYARGRDVQRNISMITSRGCPYGCIFCSVHLSMGKAWRPHSCEYVIEHIRMLSSKYGVKHIHFEDDNLFYDPKRFYPIFAVLKREKITWDTPNGIRVSRAIDEDMLSEMKSSGCRLLNIAVETGDEKVMEFIKKKVNFNDVIEFAKCCKKVGLPLGAYFILGFPGETHETMDKTISFATHLAKHYNVKIINFIATPLFGTELYDICAKNKYFVKEITPRTLSESINSDGFSLIQTDLLSANDVQRASRLFYSKMLMISLKKNIKNPIKLLRKISNFYSFKKIIQRLIGR